MRNSPKNLHNKILGRKGETIARKFLKKQGYRILKRNYTCPFGEADLLAKEGEELVFVEVKTRLSEDFGSPSEAVNDKKQQKYYRIAEYYFLANAQMPFRFDVVEVLDGVPTLYKNAF